MLNCKTGSECQSKNISLILTGCPISSVSCQKCEGYFAKVELVYQKGDGQIGLFCQNTRGHQVNYSILYSSLSVYNQCLIV